MEELVKLAVNYGLGVVLSIAVLFLSKFLLVKVFEQHKEERDIWMKIADNHFKYQEEAHRYQREEHKEILSGLKALNNK